MTEDFSEDKYNSYISELFLRFPSVQKVPFGQAYKPGTERMTEFDVLLGSPSAAFRSVHVAGTNGKGSVSNMLASCLAGAGYKTGIYTSPHISDFRERAAIAGGGAMRARGQASIVPKEYVFDFLTRFRQDFERLSLSFFEITTGLAFKWFADEKVDVAVIETGLGGRLDSTNIITPVLSIVTGIGLDHCDLLGHTLEAIAGEKAGIFKDRVPALVGEVLPETEAVFADKAAVTGSALMFAEREVPSLWAHREHIIGNMDLRGNYQEKNLRTVLVALDILRKEFPAIFSTLRGDPVDRIIDSIVHTASYMDFHGRWEMLCHSPEVICDIGHNAQALSYNFRKLREMSDSGEYSSLIIIYAVMADKDLDAILPLMPPEATYIFATPSTSRALPAAEILARYKDFCRKEGRTHGLVFASDSVPEAIETAFSLSGVGPDSLDGAQASTSARPLIYIGGSTFAVADAVRYFSGHGKTKPVPNT